MTRPLLSIGALLLAAGAASAAPTPPAASPLAALSKAKTVQVTETMMTSAPSGGPLQTRETLAVTLSRPNQVHIEQTTKGAAVPDMVLVSDGKTMTQYSAERKQYRTQDAPPSGFGTDGLPGLAPLPATAKPKTTVLNGKPALLYSVSQTMNGRALTQKLWVDARTHLPLRQSVFLSTSGGAAQEFQRIVFSDWRLDKPVQSTAFVFTPPAGVTEYKEPQLLAKGTEAPDFTVQDQNGKPVKLSDYRGKVVVLDFWATWCGPCQQSLPHTNKVAEQFQGKNVVVLAVNVWDTQDAFNKWLPQHKEFDALSFAIDTSPSGKDIATSLYNVTGIPTQYVIDPTGKIVQTFVGYDGPSDDLANAIKAAGGAG